MKIVSLALALVALGLFASLGPRVTYTASSSGEPSGEVLGVWPGWGVQQDLGRMHGRVGHFRIWASAVPGSSVATLNASLVDAVTNALVRQTRIDLTPEFRPVPRSLVFPGYSVPPGQKLRLQLQVDTDAASHVIYGLADPRPGLANATFGGDSDAAGRPIAFAHLQSGSGLRAAIAGEQSQLVRLVLAAGLGLIAVLAHPRVAAVLGKAGRSGRRLSRRPLAWTRKLVQLGVAPNTRGPESAGRGFLSAPWYPWVLAAVPILHFLASNQQQFALIEAIVPLMIALVVVTTSVVCLRLLLSDWHRPAAVAAVATVIIFGYGHVRNALDMRVDESVLFALAFVLLVASVGVAARAGNNLSRWAQFFNLVAAVLFLFPTASLVGGAVTSRDRLSSTDGAAWVDPVDQLFPTGLPKASEQRPDIYYIVLDEYGRHDTLGAYDNSSFLHELERRGFYIASKATGNYVDTAHSIASILNLDYIDNLRPEASVNKEVWLETIIQHHAVGSILQQLGYTYVHLESGYEWTDEAPPSDVLVTFTPEGVRTSTRDVGFRYEISVASLLTGPFVRELVHTTALEPIVGHQLAPPPGLPYGWYHPGRTLQTFEFLTQPIDVERPKFVFAHIVKPHDPFHFDQHGNISSDTSAFGGFDDAHDPSVPDAYIGQMIYINSQILKMVDGILGNYDSNDLPVIMISSDHGRKVGGDDVFKVLAAFHLPGSDGEPIGDSVILVNQFRIVFDYLFGFNLGLLEDRKF